MFRYVDDTLRRGLLADASRRCARSVALGRPPRTGGRPAIPSRGGRDAARAWRVDWAIRSRRVDCAHRRRCPPRGSYHNHDEGGPVVANASDSLTGGFDPLSRREGNESDFLAARLCDHVRGIELSDPFDPGLRDMAQSRRAEQDDLSTLTSIIDAGSSLNPGLAARTLISEFGTIGAVFAAPSICQRNICGDEAAVLSIARFWDIVRRVLRSQAVSRPLIDSADALARYVAFDMGARRTETLRAFYLDLKNRLIREETVSVGTVDRTAVHPREIVRRALELNATGLILVHNHPSGDPTPSEADLAETTRLEGAAALFGIVLHDHYIVATGGVRSVFGNITPGPKFGVAGRLGGPGA